MAPRHVLAVMKPSKSENRPVPPDKPRFGASQYVEQWLFYKRPGCQRCKNSGLFLGQQTLTLTGLQKLLIITTPSRPDDYSTL